MELGVPLENIWTERHSPPQIENSFRRQNLLSATCQQKQLTRTQGKQASLFWWLSLLGFFIGTIVIVMFLVPRVSSEVDDFKNLNSFMWDQVFTKTNELSGVMMDTWDSAQDSSLLDSEALRIPSTNSFLVPGRRTDYTVRVKNSVDKTKEQDTEPHCAIERNNLINISDGDYVVCFSHGFAGMHMAQCWCQVVGRSDYSPMCLSILRRFGRNKTSPQVIPHLDVHTPTLCQLETAIAHQRVSVFDERDPYAQTLLDTAHTRNSCLSKSRQNCMVLRADRKAESLRLVQRDIVYKDFGFGPEPKNMNKDLSLPESAHKVKFQPGFYFIPASLSMTSALDRLFEPVAAGPQTAYKSPPLILNNEEAKDVLPRNTEPVLVHGGQNTGLLVQNRYTDHVARSTHQTWLEAEKRTCMERVCEGESKGKLDYCKGNTKGLTVFQERTCKMCFSKTGTMLERHCQSQVNREAVAFYVLCGMLASFIMIGIATVVYHRIRAGRRIRARREAEPELPVVPLRREIHNPNMATIVEEDGRFLMRQVPKSWYRRFWPLSSTETVDLTAHRGGTALEKPRGRWFQPFLPQGSLALYGPAAKRGHNTEKLQKKRDDSPTPGPQHRSPSLPPVIGTRVSIDSEYARFSRHPLAQIDANSIDSSRDRVDARSSLDSRHNSRRVVSTGREGDAITRRTVTNSLEYPQNPPFIDPGMNVGEA